MIFYYLDASAWVKRYYQEAGTDWIQDLFRANHEICFTSLGLIEVIATLSRKCKAREINSVDFEEKLQDLEIDWNSFIHIQLNTEVFDIAKKVVKESALFLKSRFAGEGDQLIFITSDNELKQATQDYGLAVIAPDEQTI